MAQYFLRGLADSIWRRFKARAAIEGVTIKDAMIKVIEAYADGLKLPKDKK